MHSIEAFLGVVKICNERMDDNGGGTAFTIASSEVNASSKGASCCGQGKLTVPRTGALTVQNPVLVLGT
ncbi:hypothetical protein BVC80_1543g85 [Macleaya cordata]|uniref:Uncharacterized protein n=1 Tax=Macleaya cordata TaxID=56857 RepID=A0A200R1T6_MACCD|nr:hypothetical protein BVC80_1543g85 [Macleaya cordata]